MSTVIRPELSVKNRYHLSKHRYYELKHFCLQYPEWKQNYISLDGFPEKVSFGDLKNSRSYKSDPTFIYAEARLYFAERMNLVENAVKEAADDLSSYLLKAVTEGLSYEAMNKIDRIPCCKDVWYDIYRKFFWLLDKTRK